MFSTIFRHDRLNNNVEDAWNLSNGLTESLILIHTHTRTHIHNTLLWTLTYGRAHAGRPARTYIQQLCEDTGCSPDDLPEVMNDREKWREKVRDIRASGTT